MVESAGGLHEFVDSLARVEDSMLFNAGVNNNSMSPDGIMSAGAGLGGVGS